MKAISSIELLLMLMVFAPEPRPEKKIEPKPAAEIDGYYQAIGGDSTGKYQGIVEVKKIGQVYVVQWTFPGKLYTGIGMKHDESLVIGWYDGVKTRGVSVFKLDTLEGYWTSLPGDGQKKPESWHKITLPKKVDE